MKHTASALKWLAEKRARTAHDLEQTARIAAEVEKRLEGLKLDLAALDRTVRIYDARIDPEQIEAVNGWQGSYGKRGALREAVAAVLKSHWPAWVPTDAVEMLVRLELGLVFETQAERKRWYDNTFRDALKKLVTDGLAERFQDPDVFTSEVGRWRWRAPAEDEVVTLKELRAGYSP